MPVRADPHAAFLARDGCRLNPSLWSAESATGMVATAHYLATIAGTEVLARGGNAFDAAVACSAALGVCEPAGSGLGGMTMALVHHAASGRTFTLEGPCRAPRAATPEQLRGRRRYRGYRAIAVPTNPAVLDHTLRHYGTLSPSEVLAPAVRLAEEGYPISQTQHRLMRRYARTLGRYSAGEVFLTPSAAPLTPGTWLRQPALGRTLRRLASHGFLDFYRGQIARSICRDLGRNGAFVRPDDLADVPWPRENRPLTGYLDDIEIMAVGPPAGGAAVVQMCKLLSAVTRERFDPDSPEGAVLLAAIIRRARRDRRRYALRMGSQDLGGVAELISDESTRRAAEDVRSILGAMDGPDSTGERRGGETSHLSVVDQRGNIVSMTQSIERSFGAAVITPDLGFLYNGYLRTFKVANQRHPHFLRAGAVARSNAAPTIAFHNGEPYAALGSTGSESTASGIFQVLLRLRSQSPFEAVHAPRLHCTPEGLVCLEVDRFARETRAAITRCGFEVKPLESYSFRSGGVQLLVHQDDRWCGVADPRRDGAALGPSS